MKRKFEAMKKDDKIKFSVTLPVFVLFFVLSAGLAFVVGTYIGRAIFSAFAN